MFKTKYNMRCIFSTQETTENYLTLHKNHVVLVNKKEHEDREA